MPGESNRLKVAKNWGCCHQPFSSAIARPSDNRFTDPHRGGTYRLARVLLHLWVADGEAGIIATWFAVAARADAVIDEKEREAPLWTPRGFLDAVVGPFTAFFQTHGWLALLMLSAISLYQLPNFVMGPMSNPFYHDIGLSKTLWALCAARSD